MGGDVGILTSLRSAWPAPGLPPHTVDVEALLARVRQLEAERDDLWRWTCHLERLAQGGLMAGGMVHDVTNLLTAILGRSDLALARGDVAALRTALLGNAELSRHAAETLRVYLAFARRQDVRRDRVRVSAVVADAVRFLHHAARAANVTFATRVSEHDEVVCNRTLLLQAVVNLLLNAIHATAATRGRVVVRTERRGWLLLLEVEDDGPGVPASLRSRLFEPFATTDPRASVGPRSGTGLGLFVTRQIVEEMGGRIRFRTREGEGTTFTVLLRSEPPRDAPSREEGPRGV
jgi:two-component system CheB/CheR fusion protein